jgi:hypothetical protein
MKHWENAKMVIFGSNRWQEIKYAVNKEYGNMDVSSPYVRYRNQRIWLDEFTTSPHGFKEESDLCGMEIHAAACSSMFTAHLIHLSKDGECAKVFYSFCKG